MAEWKSLDRMTINGSLRWHSDNFLKSKILYSLGIRWPVIPDRWMLRAHLSNRYRLPTFNDRYWHPGGNLDLLPETGWGTDVGSTLGLLDAGIQHHRLQWQFSAHSTWVRNWIQWVPSDGYWSPVNFKEVWARGIESGLTYSFNQEPLNFRAVVDYAWTRSAVRSAMPPDLKGTDLRYVPQHMIRSHLSVAFESFTTSIYYRYTGPRFTTEDNDPFYRLDPHHTLDLSTGYTLRDQIYSMTFRIKINNILNEQYQMVRGFPMPGRSFSMGIQFKFSNTAQ